jgi:hypothetical protein
MAVAQRFSIVGLPELQFFDIVYPDDLLPPAPDPQPEPAAVFTETVACQGGYCTSCR